MKFSEEILKEFNLAPDEEKEPVNIMKIGEILGFLEKCAERISGKSRLYHDSSDEEIQMDCMDIVTAKLNDFTQAFRDLIIFMRKEEGSYKGNKSLRYCINSYDTFGFDQTEAEQLFLQELMLRNEITHDYFNQKLHQKKLIWIMVNCADGAVDVCDNLRKYCTDHNLLEKYADKIN